MIDFKDWMNRMNGRLEEWGKQRHLWPMFSSSTPEITPALAGALTRMFDGAFPDDLLSFYSTVTGGCQIWRQKRTVPNIAHLEGWSGIIQCGFEILPAAEMEKSRHDMRQLLETLQGDFPKLELSLRPFVKYGIPIFAGEAPMRLICLPENPLAPAGIYLVSLDYCLEGIPSLRLAEDFSSWLITLEGICYLAPETGILGAWHNGTLLSPSIEVRRAIVEAIEHRTAAQIFERQLR